MSDDNDSQEDDSYFSKGHKIFFTEGGRTN